MKKIKMNKTKIKYVTALAMTPLVFVGTITTSTILMSNNLLRARSLPTKVTLQSILGASKAITHVFETTPSAADIMDWLVQENEGFKYANEVICTSSTDNAATLTVKSDSEHYNPSTDNTVNVSYTTSTGRSISEFFNNQTTYNITKNSDSSQTKYFPDTKPTETQVLQAITNYKSGDTFINTNQLKVKDGNNGIVWNAANDVYEFEIQPVTNSNFYASSAASVKLQFNAKRQEVSTNTLTMSSFYMERPPEGSDPEVQVYMVLKAGNKGDPNSLFYDLFQDDSCYDNFTWDTSTILAPQFELSGSEKYTTKTDDQQQTPTKVTLTINTSQVNLATLIICNTYQTGTTYNKYLDSMTESNPDGFINKPTRDDVIFAVSQGSGSGNTPITLNTNQVLTEDWNYSDVAKTGTVVLKALPNSSVYTGSVTISFKWA